MPLLNSDQHKWQEKIIEEQTLIYKGSPNTAHGLLKIINSKDNISDVLKGYLQSNKEFSSGYIETPKHSIAWVDHIRSWPIFYTEQNGDFFISQDAYAIKDKIMNAEFDQESLIEFKLSGYVTGSETLIEGLQSLNPGEYCIWDKNNKTLNIHKYFSYIPTFDSKISNKEAIEIQNKVFDDIILRIIKDANGRTIWIPLSGGLDSRILLCKLHEHGYKNIETFTYGPRFNFEGLIAKKIAKKLNVPWRFVTVPTKTLYNYFKDDNRKEFFKFAGNLKTIPCMREYGAIRYLHETGQIDEDAIFLNGQSGDYITGGHLSKACKENKKYNKETFYDVLINKHYDLWKQYKTTDNLALIKLKIDRFIKQITGKDLLIKGQIDGATNEEVWEYEGRQICYVANGQRVYEYFGYDWEMPLWEKSLVDFYQPLSFDMKYGQKIYKKYLQSYNYMGLFPTEEPYIWRWPIPMLWVIPMAQIIGLLRGREIKDNFYAKMRYWGHYANQYKFFEYQKHTQTYKDTRNIIALYAEEYLKENESSL